MLVCSCSRLCVYHSIYSVSFNMCVGGLVCFIQISRGAPNAQTRSHRFMARAENVGGRQTKVADEGTGGTQRRKSGNNTQRVRARVGAVIHNKLNNNKCQNLIIRIKLTSLKLKSAAGLSFYIHVVLSFIMLSLINNKQ